MKYNKLVRDNILEIIRQGGVEPVFHIAGDEEYYQKLKEKLQEEVKEFLADESADELADILEVIDAISEYKKFDDIEKIQNSKAEKRGKFNERIILEES